MSELWQNETLLGESGVGKWTMSLNMAYGSNRERDIHRFFYYHFKIEILLTSKTLSSVWLKAGDVHCIQIKVLNIYFLTKKIMVLLIPSKYFDLYESSVVDLESSRV